MEEFSKYRIYKYKSIKYKIDLFLFKGTIFIIFNVNIMISTFILLTTKTKAKYTELQIKIIVKQTNKKIIIKKCCNNVTIIMS